jgi:hypothetical protein
VPEMEVLVPEMEVVGGLKRDGLGQGRTGRVGALGKAGWQGGEVTTPVTGVGGHRFGRCLRLGEMKVVYAGGVHGDAVVLSLPFIWRCGGGAPVPLLSVGQMLFLSSLLFDKKSTRGPSKI